MQDLEAQNNQRTIEPKLKIIRNADISMSMIFFETKQEYDDNVNAVYNKYKRENDEHNGRMKIIKVPDLTLYQIKACRWDIFPTILIGYVGMKSYGRFMMDSISEILMDGNDGVETSECTLSSVLSNVAQ